MTAWPSVRGTRMRLTRLDECCAVLPAATPCASLVSKGFVSVAWSPEVSEAEEIELKNANGDVCVSDPGCDVLKWLNVTISLCNVDPDILNFVTGSPVVLDAAGKNVGNRVQTGEACNANFALEVWTDIPNGVCATTGQKEYGYFVAPCIGKGILGDFTIENDALNLELTAKARSGSGWLNGPYDVDASTIALPVVPGPLLTPFGPLDVLDLHKTVVPPPDETDGCVPMPA